MSFCMFVFSPSLLNSLLHLSLGALVAEEAFHAADHDDPHPYKIKASPD